MGDKRLHAQLLKLRFVMERRRPETDAKETELVMANYFGARGFALKCVRPLSLALPRCSDEMKNVFKHYAASGPGSEAVLLNIDEFRRLCRDTRLNLDLGTVGASPTE